MYESKNSSVRQRYRRVLAQLIAMASLSVLVVGCGADAGQPNGSPPASVRLGYLANLTHAPALLAVDQGFFQGALGSKTHLGVQTFNAGPAEIEALFGGAIDIGFIGPSPAINAYVKSHGDALRIVAGAASGGASLVVRAGAHIRTAADLRGKTIATPQLGNTQDVALRAYLLANGLRTDLQGGGDAKVVPTENGTTLQLFQDGKIDGAWVPEPWASRLEVDAGGQQLIDERDLWPARRFVSNEVIATRTFLAQHPDTVKAVLRGELTALDWIQKNPSEAKAALNQSLRVITQKALTPAVLDLAWSRLTFTIDPLAATLRKEAADEVMVGIVPAASIEGIVDLRLLNQVLTSQGRPPVGSGGLGAE